MAIDPMTALSIGQSVVGFMEANREAQQQQAYYLANRQRAIKARDLKIQTLNQRLIQENQAIASQKFQLEIERLKKQGSLEVATGEAGIAGASVDALYNDFSAQALRGKTVLSQQADAIEKQITLEKRGADAEAESRINSVRQGQKPSFLAHAVGGAAKATGTYYSGLSETEQDAFLKRFSIG
jgi:uncharacterized protein (DUF3084 family)